MRISPSILSVYDKDYEAVIKMLESVQADYIHIDVMDNIFVPNYTFDDAFVKILKKKTDIPLDVHLMITNPDEDYLNYIDAGADIVTFHFEATTNHAELIKKIKNAGAKVGVSIKPNTSVNVLEPFLDQLDLILVMSVEPGFGGQKFIPSAVEKIAYLDKLRKDKNYKYLIEVDGGINSETSKLVKKAGCDIIVVGSYLMNSTSIVDTYNELKNTK